MSFEYLFKIYFCLQTGYNIITTIITCLQAEFKQNENVCEGTLPTGE